MHKNLIVRVFSLILAVFLVAGLVGCNNNTPAGGDSSGEDPTVSVPDGLDISGNVEGSASVERLYTALYAGSETLVRSNPNRGFRGYIDINSFDRTEEEVKQVCENWMTRHYTYASSTVAVCYIYPTVYRGKDLDEKFFNTLEWVLEYAREKKITYVFRFAYYATWEGFNDRTPTTEEVIPHMNQIAESGLFEEYKDVLHVFQVGFIGRYGEWHSHDTPVDDKLVINTFLEKLLPDGVFAQVRQPRYKDLVDDSNSKKALIGYNHDVFAGIEDCSQKGGETFSYGYEGWDAVMKDAAYTPQDGELHFQGDTDALYGVNPNGYSVIIGMSQIRMTTFSSENGYLELGPQVGGAMHEWREMPITEKWCKENGILYSENWFKNANGETVERNVLEFVQDYLGYRLSATKLSTKEENGKLKVNLDLVNSGFSAAFNISSKLVILDKDGNKVSEAVAGNPKDWHPTDPENYDDRTQLTHSLSAELTMPTEKGEYRLALELMSTSGVTARLDNNINFENGCNILHTFKI